MQGYNKNIYYFKDLYTIMLENSKFDIPSVQWKVK